MYYMFKLDLWKRKKQVINTHNTKKYDGFMSLERASKRMALESLNWHQSKHVKKVDENGVATYSDLYYYLFQHMPTKVLDE